MNPNGSMWVSISIHHPRFPENCQLGFERRSKIKTVPEKDRLIFVTVLLDYPLG